ncbi:MAG: DNA-3-methyladenine glycosylase family protein [Flammeovirgaceae bacterium]
MQKFYIGTPTEFDFDLCLQFLQRSPLEKLHRVEDGAVLKLLAIGNQQVLFRITGQKARLQVEIMNMRISTRGVRHLKDYITEWFDLATDLKPFYSMAKKDKLLKELVRKFHGYRIIGQPDLYESLIWAVLGQQINLGFAYTLKARFVEKYGASLSGSGHRFYLFPTCNTIAQLSPNDLLPLQFSRQKANYTIGISQAFAVGKISKEMLTGMPLAQAKEILIQTKGIGNWTANYALMKTFRYTDAFPLEDAGLHNAIKNLKGMQLKPTVEQVKSIFKKYKGWEAYATLYLWKSL